MAAKVDQFFQFATKIGSLGRFECKDAFWQYVSCDDGESDTRLIFGLCWLSFWLLLLCWLILFFFWLMLAFS